MQFPPSYNLRVSPGAGPSTDSAWITFQGTLKAGPCDFRHGHDPLFSAAGKILDYAKEKNPPTFNIKPKEITETERHWDSWIFYQLMGFPGVLAHREKRDLLIE